MLTVLMAIHNGAPTLPRVLDAYGRLDPPAGGWKLLSVDNGSTDATPEILRSYAAKVPIERLVIETASQNCARNRGLSAIEGDLVVLADDDAIPAPSWLAEMRSVADTHPEFSMFGGVIRPSWDAPPPEWLLSWAPLSPSYSLTDPAWEEGPIKSDLIFSSNMAIRTAALEGHRFNESIGPRPGEYPMGSETELTRRLTREGHRAWHTRRAEVEHIIRAVQMTPEWLLARAIRYGRGQYRLRCANEGGSARSPLGVPAQILVGAAVQAGRRILAVVAGDAEDAFRRSWSRNYLVGEIREARALRREQRGRREAARPA